MSSDQPRTPTSSPSPISAEDEFIDRREALRRLAKFAGYTAPALLVLLKSDKAIGQSVPSDARLKRDVVFVGRLDDGLGLYRYRYVWSDRLFVGVMAQEVRIVDPKAVVDMPGGYLGVDYARLGLRLRTWDEFTRA